MSLPVRDRFRRVCVLGLGYIGLPTAAVIASRGVSVIGVDINQRVVDTINQARIHIEDGSRLPAGRQIAAGLDQQDA